jgi:hypothetical protein
MKTLRETAETFALNQWLSDYPFDMSYADILDLLHSGQHYDSDDVTVWETVEDYPGSDIAEMIDDTRSAFERHAADLLSCAHE